MALSNFTVQVEKREKEIVNHSSKCGELNHREQKINVKLMTGAYNVTLTTRRRRGRRRRRRGRRRWRRRKRRRRRRRRG